MSFLTGHHCHSCRFEALDFGNLEFFCSPVRPLYSWIWHHWSLIQRGCDCCGPQLPCFSFLLDLDCTLFSPGLRFVWSVTNPLTLFKVRILECVTGWGKIYILQSRGTVATTFSQHPGRDSQGPRILPGDNHLLGCDDRCVVIATAIFMDRCSCRQKGCGVVLLTHSPPSVLQFRHADSCCRIRLLPPLQIRFWHQKGRPVFSVTAASLCGPSTPRPPV